MRHQQRRTTSHASIPTSSKALYFAAVSSSILAPTRGEPILGSDFACHDLCIQHQVSPRTSRPSQSSKFAIVATFSSSDLPCQATVTNDLSEYLISERQTHDLEIATIHEFKDQPAFRLFAYCLAIFVPQLPQKV